MHKAYYKLEISCKSHKISTDIYCQRVAWGCWYILITVCFVTFWKFTPHSPTEYANISSLPFLQVIKSLSQCNSHLYFYLFHRYSISVVHACAHKTGFLWRTNVLRNICINYNCNRNLFTDSLYNQQWILVLLY